MWSGDRERGEAGVGGDDRGGPGPGGVDVQDAAAGHNPAASDRCYIAQLAVEGGFNGIAVQIGLVEKLPILETIKAIVTAVNRRCPTSLAAGAPGAMSIPEVSDVHPGRHRGRPAAAVPPEDRGRGDRAVCAQRCAEASDQGGEQGSVGPVQAWSRVGSTEYGDFVAQDEEFDVLDEDALPSSASHLRSRSKIR
jgi:hypothetical protein